MRVLIPKPHGEAIEARKQLMQQLSQQFSLLRMEDVRHTNAVLVTLGLTPDDYAQYDLKFERGEFYLDLQEKPKEGPQKEPMPITAGSVANGQAAVPMS